MKKFFLIFISLITVFSLVACGPADKNVPEKVRLENVYLTEKMPLPEDVDIYSVVASGDNVYLRGSKHVETTNDDGYTEYEYYEVIYRTDKAFAELTEFFTFQSEDYWDEATGYSSNKYFDRATSDGQGGLWISISEYEGWPDENGNGWTSRNNSTLYRYAEDGSVTREVNCREILEAVPDIEDSELEYFYINSIAQTGDGNLYLCIGTRIIAIDAEGNIITSKEIDENKNFGDMVALENGNIRSVRYDWSGEEAKAEIVEYDVKTNEIKTLVTLSVNDNIIMSPSGNVYVNDYYVVSKVDVNTGEKTPMLDWINSDINCDRLFGTTFVGDDVYTLEWDNDYANRSLLHLTPASDGDAIEKYIITLAAKDISSELKSMIIDYNRSSVDYRIQVKSYGWDEGSTERFDMDLLSGNVPDIISLDQLNVEKYATKGIFADLGALIDADETLSRSDFLPNVLEAAEIQGKLYRLPISFSVRSLVGKTSVIGERTTWTWDDFLELQRQYPNAEMLSEYSRIRMFDSFLPHIIDDFIDYDTGKSNFTDGSFGRFLEFTKTLPEDIDWDTYYEGIDWEEYDARYREDRTLLMLTYNSGFDNNFYISDNFGSVPINYIGFPTSSGNGNALYFNLQFAIGEKSIYKEEAWDFLKMVFEEEYQKEYVWTFPVIKTAFEEKKQECIDMLLGDFEGDDYVDEVMPLLSSTYAEKSLVATPGNVIVEPELPETLPTDNGVSERTQRFLEFVEENYRMATTATKLARQEDPMIEVIQSEAAAYFDGAKSLEETCKIIESRVNLYLAENM